MALTNNGTVVNLPASRIPSGYTLPTVSTFTDYEYESKDVVLSVLKSTVENATETTTLTNILTNATIGINKQVSDLITADADVSNTVTAYAELKMIDSNQAASGSNDFYNDTAMSYQCTVRFYWKSA